jgi:hypothetical protein
MTEEQLAEFLERNLTVVVNKEYDHANYIPNYDPVYLSVTIKLGEKVVSISPHNK